VILRGVVAQALPGLSSEQLIEAIGNLEQRDALRWVRDAALAFVDARLPDPRARAAFEHPLAAVAFPHMLADAYRSGQAGEFGPWIDEYARRHPVRILAALVSTAFARSDAPRPVGTDDIEAAVARAMREAPSPRGLFVTAATDARTHALTQPVVDACRAEGLGIVWLRLGSRVRSGDPGDVDVTRRPALDAAGTEEEARGLRLNLPRSATSDAAHAVVRRLWAIAPEWAAARRIGRAAADAGAEFTFVIPDKAPAARAIVGALQERGCPALTYMPSIELGAPAIARFAADRVLVASPVIAATFARYGVPRDHLTAVGSTEADRVIHAARAMAGHAPTGPVRVLFLTKWPENAIDNLAVLDATIAGCRQAGRPFVIRVRPHPKDRERYRSRLGPDVVLDEGEYDAAVAGADAAVTAMSNSAFHAMAIGLPMVVANLNPKIDLGHRRLFERPDLPKAIHFAGSASAVRDAVARMLGEAGARYTLPPSMAQDLFLSLDGKSAGRVAAAVRHEATRPREVLPHV